MAFSQSGDKLVIVSVNPNHNVAIFDLKIGALISHSKGGKQIIAAVEFKNEADFVTVGPKHFRHWHFENKNI